VLVETSFALFLQDNTSACLSIAYQFIVLYFILDQTREIMYFNHFGRIQWMEEAKTGIKPMVEIKRRGEPCVRPRTKTSIEPMVENIYINRSPSGIGSIPVFVRGRTQGSPLHSFSDIGSKNIQELLCPPSIGYALSLCKKEFNLL